MSSHRKDICKSALKRRILLLDLPPGGELDETQVATEFGLSRTPLREIFQALAGEGYLRLEVNRGARVAAMDVADLRSLLQTAPLLYTSVIRQAATNWQAEDLARLKEIHGQFRAAVQAGKPEAAILENHALLTGMGEVAANPYLLPALNRMLIDHTRFGQGFFRPESKKERKQVRKAAQRYDAMIAAIESRDADQAAALILQSWEAWRDQIERFLRADPLPMEAIPGVVAAGDQA